MLRKNDLQLKSAFYSKHATVYQDSNVPPKACVLYFHGGGLLYGDRKDLPELHVKKFTEAGYAIIAFDYPLAPATKIDEILADVCNSVQDYCEHPETFIHSSDTNLPNGSGQIQNIEESTLENNTSTTLPYFLWGRSAGAYLCLLAAANGEFPIKPSGILSYYGYGFFCDNWFNTPSPYYVTLPTVAGTCLDKLPTTPHADGGLTTHYSAYVFARQTGKWTSLFFEGREKHFYLNYSLRLCEKLPCPLFCAHSTGDTDVPFAEFTELTNRYNPMRFVASGSTHDFDRDESSDATKRLLDATIEFLENHIS